MKPKHFCIFLLWIFAPYLSRAEVLIYRGTTKIVEIGRTPHPKFSGAFLIYEVETGIWETLFYSAYIDPSTRKQVKLYDQVGFTDLKKLEVDQDSSRFHTVFYRTETTLEEDHPPASDSVWIKGENKALKTEPNKTYQFPARFNLDFRRARETPDLEDGLHHGKITELHGDFVFSSYQTRIANNAGETLIETILRLKAGK